MCRDDSERGYEADEGCEEFTVGKVRASAHARAGAIRVVRSPRSLRGVEVTFWVEGEWGVEVGRVIVGRVSILEFRVREWMFEVVMRIHTM